MVWRAPHMLNKSQISASLDQNIRPRGTKPMRLKELLKKYVHHRKGTAVVEYALMMAIIAVILVMVLPPLTPTIASTFALFASVFAN